jgi:hypothetical protein
VNLFDLAAQLGLGLIAPFFGSPVFQPENDSAGVTRPVCANSKARRSHQRVDLACARFMVSANSGCLLITPKASRQLQENQAETHRFWQTRLF